jgi:hypothetical protein
MSWHYLAEEEPVHSEPVLVECEDGEQIMGRWRDTEFVSASETCARFVIWDATKWEEPDNN